MSCLSLILGLVVVLSLPTYASPPINSLVISTLLPPMLGCHVLHEMSKIIASPCEVK